MRSLFAVLAFISVTWAGIAEAGCSAGVVELKNENAHIRFNVELAVTPSERAKGLMFRSELPERDGMLFVFDPPQSVVFWMKNTLIPLDIIFADRTGVVTRVHENAIPGDETIIEGGDGVFAVLEINAGLARRYGIGPGMVMRHEIFSKGPPIWPC